MSVPAFGQELSPLVRTVVAMGSAEYNPWRALRLRDDIELRWARLPDSFGGGAAVERDGQLFVVLDSRLDRTERRSILEHELCHVRRGLLPRWAPDPILQKDEHAVRRETARRLVPLDELQRFVAQRGSVDEPVTASCVATHFDVTMEVAMDACRLAV